MSLALSISATPDVQPVQNQKSRIRMKQDSTYTLRCRRMSLVGILLTAWGLGLGGNGNQAQPTSLSPSSQFVLRDGDRVVYYGNTLLERDRHYGALETMLRTRFAGKKLSFRNLAWPGDTVNVQLRPLNFGSMERHLQQQKPTVVFVSFGMNEAYEGTSGLKTYLEGYRRQLAMLQKLQARLILLSPIRQEPIGPPVRDPKPYNTNAALYHDATKKLAAEWNLTYLDLYSSLIPVESPRIPLTDNGIHLNRYGYWRLSETVAQSLGLSTKWDVALDFGKRQTLYLKGTQIGQLQWHPDGLSFVATNYVLPNPAPEGSPEDADQQAAHRRLIVKGLPPGDYELLADNQLIARATAEQWDQGLVLTADPTYQQARKLREMVIEKDLLFFHRWRAHNGEYIYGRRSKPGGGNAGNPTFPSEFAELDRLLAEGDQRLDDQATPRPITYRLRRIRP